MAPRWREGLRVPEDPADPESVQQTPTGGTDVGPSCWGCSPSPSSLQPVAEKTLSLPWEAEGPGQSPSVHGLAVLLMDLVPRPLSPAWGRLRTEDRASPVGDLGTVGGIGKGTGKGCITKLDLVGTPGGDMGLASAVVVEEQGTRSSPASPLRSCG